MLGLFARNYCILSGLLQFRDSIMKNFKQITKILQYLQIGLAIVLMIMMLKGLKIISMLIKGG